MDTVNIDIKKAFDVQFLMKHNYCFILPKNKVFKVRLSQIIFDQIPADTKTEKVRVFTQITEGITGRTLWKYIKYNFNLNASTVGQKLASNQADIARLMKESFLVTLKEKETGKEKFHCKIALDKPDEYKVQQDPYLNVDKVMKMRTQELESPSPITPRNDEEKENLALKICEYTATGLPSIYEACDKFGVKYHEFATWYSTNEAIKKMYVEAVLLSKWLNNSRQASTTDKRLNELLEKGYYEETNITYQRIYTSKHPEGIFIESGKKTVQRELTPRDLIAIKQVTSGQTLPFESNVDEFDQMGDKELMEYIRSMEDKIKGINE